MASLLKVFHYQLGVAADTHNAAPGGLRQENCDFESNLGFIRLSQKEKERVRHGGTWLNLSTW